MAINNTRGIQGGDLSRQLRETLDGNVVRQAQAAPPGQQQQAVDKVTLADRLERTLRSTNTNFQQVQERIVSNQIVLDGLTNIRDEVANLRDGLKAAIDEPAGTDLVSQSINTITQLSEQLRFNNEPLLDDFNAEALGITRITPDTSQRETEQILQEADVRVQTRVDEIREEDTIDRRELEQLNVTMENVRAAVNTGRLNEQRDLQQAIEAVRQEAGRGPNAAAGNLTPDRVLELI